MKFRFLRYNLEIPYPVLLLVAAIISFWQLATFSNMLRCDIQDAMYPWRYFAGECLQSGIFPLWNPYQQFGYPFYADLQYTNWNPEVWLIGNIIGYSYPIIYFLIFFYVFMAGLGMYQLANFFTRNKSIAFFIALCWMLSGCVIAHMQQFVTVIGIAWLPFVTWQFFAFINTMSWKNCFGFSFYSYLFLTGGYQALYFMMIYFFLVIVIKKMYDLWKSNRSEFRLFLTRSVVLLFVLTILLLPVVITVYRTSGFVSRLDHGVSLNEAQLSPFSPQSFLSFFLPVVSAKSQDFIGTDITMSNVFIGIIPTILLIFSFFSKKNFLQIVLLAFSVLYFLAAMGDYLPVREFLYHYIPLMNLFRLPGLFRVVAVFFLLIHLSVFLTNHSVNFRKFSIAIFLMAIIYCSVCVTAYAFCKEKIFHFSEVKFNAYYFVHQSPTSKLVFLETLVFFILLLFIFILTLIRRKIPGWNQLTLFTFLFLFTGIQFNIYLNIAGNQNPELLTEKSKFFPSGFSNPPEISLIEYSELTDRVKHVFSNTGIFLKKPMNDAFSSFQLDGYAKLNDSFPAVKNHLLRQPIAYLSDKIISKSNWKTAQVSDKPVSFLEGTNNFNNLKFSQKDCILWKNFSPSRFELEVLNENPVLFNLQQAWFPGWNIVLNDSVVEPVLNAGFLMSLPLKPGRNHLVFQFSDNLFLVFYSLSLAAFFTLLIILLLYSDSLIYKLSGLLVVIPFVLATLLFFFRWGHIANPSSLLKFKLTPLSDNYIRTGPVKNVNNEIRSDDPKQLRMAFVKINNCNESKFIYEWSNNFYDSKIAEYIRLKFPFKIFEYKKSNNGIIVYSKGGYDDRFIREYGQNNNNDTSFFRTDLNIARLAGRFSVGPEFTIPAKNIFTKETQGALVKFQILSELKNKPKIHLQIENLIKPDDQWYQEYDLTAWVLNENQLNNVVVSCFPYWKTDDYSVLRIYFTAKERNSTIIESFKVVSIKEKNK